MDCAALKPASTDAFESAEIMSAESAAELQLLQFTAASAVCAESASTSTEAHLHLAQPRAQIPHAVTTVASTDDAGLASGLPPRLCSESPAKLKDRRREPRLVRDVGGASSSPPPAATKPVPLDVQSCDEAFELLAERRAAYFAQSLCDCCACTASDQLVPNGEPLSAAVLRGCNAGVRRCPERCRRRLVGRPSCLHHRRTECATRGETSKPIAAEDRSI